MGRLFNKLFSKKGQDRPEDYAANGSPAVDDAHAIANNHFAAQDLNSTFNWFCIS